MYVSPHRLPHLLAPNRYFTPQAHEEELAHVLTQTWHVVATTRDLQRPGDFVTTDLCGTPVQIRNFKGQIVALSNVCAHRHALICSRKHGNSPTMRCQYHGWEYQSDGSTGRIPEPKNFVPFDGLRPCLPRYAVACVGQLVLVNISPNPEPIEDFFGADFYKQLVDRFDERWVPALHFSPEYPVNWKIPIENSLEAYHVPSVHPRTFREAPDEPRAEHQLTERHTAFGSTLPFSPHNAIDRFFQTTESRFVRWLGYEATQSYWQHHHFPNLLFSFTDAISLCNCVLPTGPTSSQANVFQFGRLPSRSGAMKSLVARFWAKLTAALTKRILLEDMQIFPAIQAGLIASTQAGVLGRCEERIHRFQHHLQCLIPSSQSPTK